jgi:hypothetical protein
MIGVIAANVTTPIGSVFPGDDEEELHTFLLDKCAPRAVVKIAGLSGPSEAEQIKRTSGGHRWNMSTKEMSMFMEKCAALTGYLLQAEEELLAMPFLSH